MTPQPYRVLVAIMFCWLIALGTPPGAMAQKAENTLSPYFFIENGEEDLDRMPLKSTQVTAKINGVIAQVNVVQHYANEGSRPIHARYVFPASTRAAVHGMRMQIGEQLVVAQIQERQRAEDTFQTAKIGGQSSSLLTEERPNVFTMKVANIMPGDNVRIELSYTELMVPTDGTYEFVYPAVVGPRYSTVAEADSDDHHQWLKNPYLKAGRDSAATFDMDVRLSGGMEIQEVSCPSHLTDVDWENGSRASISLSPKEKNGGDRDFILRYHLAGEKIQSGLMLYEGEKENFFVLMVQPPERVTPQAIVPREYIFVVDVSGSMNGFPLNTAKTLLRDLIVGLRPTDRFNVVLFAGAAHSLAPQSLPAEPANLARATQMLDRRQGGGGTELRNALETALSAPPLEGVARSVVVVTDGYIAVERNVFNLIEQHLDQTNFFAFGIGSSVNRHLIEGLARVGQGEPFVVCDPESAPSAAQRFRRYIESPLLTDIRIEYGAWETYDLEPAQLSNLFADRPLVVCGKWRGRPSGQIRISGISGQGAYTQTLGLHHMKDALNHDTLPYFWARARLARLSDFNPAIEKEETREEIVNLGLTYHLLTPHTAFVAVDETVRNASGSGDEVDQLLPLPKGVSNLAVGGSHNVPEPGLVFMSALLCLGGLAAWVRRRQRSRKRDRRPGTTATEESLR